MLIYYNVNVAEEHWQRPLWVPDDDDDDDDKVRFESKESYHLK